MADEVAPAVAEPNPFEGLSMGQSIVKLRADPALAPHFDSKFSDEETVGTLERARLHAVHSYYRGTVAGASKLASMTSAVNNPRPIEDAPVSEVESANTAAATRIARGVTKSNPQPLDRKALQKNMEEDYLGVLDDLGKYEQMKPYENTTDLMAAIGGSIAGGIPTPEALAGLPAKGTTVLAKMMWGGLAAGVANVATDPIVQGLSIWGSGVQEKYDPVQTALAFPVGAVIGGGLAGMGEVVSKTLLRKELSALAKDDPSIRSADVVPEPTVPVKPTAVVDEVAPPAVKENFAPDAAAGESALLERRKGPMRGEPTPSPDYVRPPESVKSLQKMVSDLEESFGVPIRQGRVEGGKNVLGHYNTGNGIIHVREYPDFSVSAHEVAHGLEKNVGPEITALTNRYAGELGPLDYEPAKARVNEGFAEFMRLYMTNPAYAQKEAPGFYSSMQNFLEQNHPETLQKLIGVQQAYKNYLDAVPTQIVAATIVRPEKETWGSWAVSKLSDAKVVPTIRNVLSLSYDALINKNQDMYRATRAIAESIKEQNGGKLVDILPSADPRAHFEMLQRSGQSAMVNILEGVVPYGKKDPVGPSMSQAITQALGKPSLTGKWDAKAVESFDVYIKARMGLVRWDQFARGEIPNPPFAESRGYYEEVIKQLEKDNASFFNASQTLNEFQKNKRYRARDAGLYGYTPEVVAKMDALPFYAPMKRDVSDLKRGAGGANIGEGGGPKGFKGSLRDTLSPLNSIIQDTLSMERAIAHNDTMRALRNFSKQAGPQGGKFVEDLPPHEVQALEFDMQTALKNALKKEGDTTPALTAQDIMDSHFGGDTISGTAFKNVRRNGRTEPIVFSSEGGVLQASRLMTKEEGYGLYELMTTAPEPVRDLGVQLLSGASSLLTSGVVTHPAYALRNIFRDQFAAWAMIPGYKPFWSAAKGIKHEATQDDFARGYAQFGGVSAGAQVAPLSHDVVQADVNSLAKQGYGIHKLTSLKGLSELISIAEAGTRLGATEVVYKQKIKMGLSEYDAMMSAVREATDLLDFGRRGSHTETMRSISPFFNSWMQSLDKANRSLNLPIKRFLTGDMAFVKDGDELSTALTAWTKLGVTGFGLGAAWAAWNWDKDSYRDMGAAGKAGNFVIPIGNDSVFLLPKPWELSLGFTAGEYAYASMIQNDPRAGGQFAKAAWDSVAPNIPVWSNPMIKTTAETIMNYNTFTGAPIVSERLAGLEKEYQTKANTSIIAKKLGKATGQSPIKIDYMISGYLGYWGKDLTTLSNGNENNDPTQNLMDWTLLRAGIKDPAMMSDAREKFWKHMGRTTGDFSQAVNTYNTLVADPQKVLQSQEYFNKLTSNRKAWVTLNSAGDEEGKQVFSADDRRAHPLNRASEAVRILNGVKTSLQENTVVDAFNKEVIPTTPDQRKKLASVVGQMALAEMVNGLIISHEPGYDKRPLFDMSVFLKQVESLSPSVGKEVAARYATKKIYSTEAVARNYDTLEKTLIQGGSRADLRLLTESVKSEGYEFGAERRKQTKLRRTTIEGQQ